MMKFIYAKIFYIVFFMLFGHSVSAITVTIEKQRVQYLKAKKALQAGHIQSFKKIPKTLQTYPLYPYLYYQYLSRSLHKVDVLEIQKFIQLYPDFFLTDKLQSKWFAQLARQKKWRIFLDNYVSQNDKKLSCLQLQARIETNDLVYLLEDTRTLWLSGESLPAQCDIAFSWLYKSDLMTNELVWQRIWLAIAEKNIGLANYLERYLDKNNQQWFQRWRKAHSMPLSVLKTAQYADIPVAREILLYAVKRIANRSINDALHYWIPLQEAYSFMTSQVDEISLLIAIRAAKTKHSDALQLLDNLNVALNDKDVFYWRLRIALKNKDWQKLYEWTKNFPPDIESIRYSWLYWRARALEEMGEHEKANISYALIAKKRDYYGFLAADRINATYAMRNHALPEDIAGKKRVENLPSVRRAKELFALYGNDYRARLEWNHAVKSMTNYQQQLAARLVSEWDWHDRAIYTLGLAKAFDDLTIRFPLLYRDDIEKYSVKRDLDVSWMFALMRAESAFIEKIKSPAGAMGLMQVMPQTGKLVAKKIGLKNFHVNDLLVAKKNIQIGSAYMQEMQKKFFGSYLLASAAYNAGPSRINRWLAKNNCQHPDIWVELIPFNETRSYVKRVLFYANVYDWLLQTEAVSLTDRLAIATADNTKKQAKMIRNCLR